MKNLYKRLKISEQATRAQIEFALEHCDKELLAEDAEAVLLNPARRKVYDRNMQSLVMLGTLRRELGLLDTPFWDEREYRDFYEEPEADLERRHGQKHKLVTRFFDKPRFRFGVIFVSLVLIYVLIYIML